MTAVDTVDKPVDNASALALVSCRGRSTRGDNTIKVVRWPHGHHVRTVGGVSLAGRYFTIAVATFVVAGYSWWRRRNGSPGGFAHRLPPLTVAIVGVFWLGVALVVLAVS